MKQLNTDPCCYTLIEFSYDITEDDFGDICVRVIPEPCNLQVASLYDARWRRNHYPDLEVELSFDFLDEKIMILSLETHSLPRKILQAFRDEGFDAYAITRHPDGTYWAFHNGVALAIDKETYEERLDAMDTAGPRLIAGMSEWRAKTRRDDLHDRRPEVTFEDVYNSAL